MSPAEQYAAKHREAVALIEAQAPLRLHAPLIESLRPAIALKATRIDDADIAIGASKFGGAPDVPEGFEWPSWNEKPLSFVAQINLEEVAPFDAEKVLPSSGVASFFALDGLDGLEETERGMWRVSWFDEPLERASQQDYAAKSLRFLIKIQLDEFDPSRQKEFFDDSRPFWFQPELEQFFEEWEKIEKSATVAESYWRPDQILGCAWVNDGRWMESECQALSTGQNWNTKWLPSTEDWRVLFQKESDYNTGLTWGDSGIASFWIRQQDLAAREFARVWMVTESA